MKILIVEQHLPSGHTKVWKLKPGKGYFTFGSSRTADLLSIDPTVSLWECVFEFAENNWKFVDFNINNFNKNIYPTLAVEGEQTIHRENCKLLLKVVEKNVSLNEFQFPTTTADSKSNFQVFQVYLNDRLIEIKLLPQRKKFYPESFKNSNGFESIYSPDWHTLKFETYTIKQKTISSASYREFGHFKLDTLIEKESRKSALILILFCFIFGAGFLSLPRNHKYLPSSTKRSSPTQIFVKNEKPKAEKPKVEKIAEPKLESAPKSVKTAATNENLPSDKGISKVAGMLKNVNTGRISSLLSKVSAQGQKSKNIIISSGITAGSGESGRALASLGNIDKSSGDWSSDNNSKGIKISTKGLGGGNSVSGISQLHGGKVGQGGVGLIEDESEIIGGLDREEIATYIKSQLGQILYCYERQLSANKDLFGKVSVKFTISGTGKVETQAINDSTLKNSNVEGCMLTKIAGWKFPVPKGGTKVIVTYPFLFKSTN